MVGPTTAAGIWAVAAVGVAIGSGLYILGIGAGILMFLALRFLTYGSDDEAGKDVAGHDGADKADAS